MWSKLFSLRVGAEGREALPLRETCKTRWLSKYRRFWWNCSWKVFHARNPHRSRGGYPRFHMCPTFGFLESIQDRPGVYEMALVKEGTSQRCKVYIGHTQSVLRRFRMYKESGSPLGGHLAPFLAAALENGCQVHMRCHYADTVEEARQHQARIQSKFDYAWCLDPSSRPVRTVKLRRIRGSGCSSSYAVCQPISKPAPASMIPAPVPILRESARSIPCPEAGLGPREPCDSNSSVASGEWTGEDLLQMLKDWDPATLMAKLGVPPDRDLTPPPAALGSKAEPQPAAAAAAAFSMTAHCY